MRLADLAAQHGVLVPEHQELGILGQPTPGQHRQATQQTANCIGKVRASRG
jgi:hypothetical protein